jgi:hypothetical protein
MFNVLFVRKTAESVESKFAAIVSQATALKEQAHSESQAVVTTIKVLSSELDRIEKVKADLAKLGV